MSGAGFSLKVKPEVLKTKSSEVSVKIRTMRGHFEGLERIMEKTNSYWIGEAGDLHRKLYKDRKDQIDEILRRLEEHPKDLLMIAQNYTNVELSVTAVIDELPGDVLA